MFENKALSTIFVETEKKIINFQKPSFIYLISSPENFWRNMFHVKPKNDSIFTIFYKNLKQ